MASGREWKLNNEALVLNLFNMRTRPQIFLCNGSLLNVLTGTRAEHLGQLIS